MKASTAIRKARQFHSLSRFGDGWQVVTRHKAGYTTSTTSTTYTQARQWYKQNVAATALELMGWEEEDSLVVEFVEGHGTAQELLERCINYCENI